MSARFLDWVYYTTGVHVVDAQHLLPFDKRDELLTQWLKAGCPFPIGV